MSAPRGWNAQADEDLIHLANSGFLIDSMAWALNRSPGTIRTRLAELRWSPPSASRTGERSRVEPERIPSEPRAQVGPRKFLGF